MDANFARCSYTEAIELLEKAVAGGKVFKEAVSWGIDMGSEMERYLAEGATRCVHRASAYALTFN